MDLTSLTSPLACYSLTPYCLQSEITQQPSEGIIPFHQRHLERTPLMQGGITDQKQWTFFLGQTNFLSLKLTWPLQLPNTKGGKLLKFITIYVHICALFDPNSAISSSPLTPIINCSVQDIHLKGGTRRLVTMGTATGRAQAGLRYQISTGTAIEVE